MIDVHWTPAWEDFLTFRAVYSRNENESGTRWRIRPIKARFKDGDRFGADAELACSEGPERFVVNVGLFSQYVDRDQLTKLEEEDCRAILRRTASDILFSHAHGLVMQLGAIARIPVARAWTAPEPEWAEMLTADTTKT